MNRKFLKIERAPMLTVGEGRGFVIDGPNGDRLVITAAHCLPHLPPADHMGDFSTMYPNLLASLGGQPSIWADCLFVDPIGDIALLGSPANKDVFEHSGAYDELVESLTPVPIADAPAQGRAWLFSLDSKWFGCSIERINNGELWVSHLEQPIQGGMSGSCIVSDEGAAIAIVNMAQVSANELKGLPIQKEDLETAQPQSVLFNAFPVFVFLRR